MSIENSVSKRMKNNIGLISGLLIIICYFNWFLFADYELVTRGHISDLYIFGFLFDSLVIIIFYGSTWLCLPAILIFIANMFIQIFRMIDASAIELAESKYSDFTQNVSNGEFSINNDISIE